MYLEDYEPIESIPEARDHSAMIAKLNEVLRPCGTYIHLYGECARITTYSCKIRPGTERILKSIDFTTILDDSRVMTQKEGATFRIMVPEDNYSLTFDMAESFNDILHNDKIASLPVMIGQGTDNFMYRKNIDSFPHLLIAGTTGSGKSVAIHNILCGLLQTHLDDTEYFLIDGKGSELSLYEGIGGFHFIRDTQEAVRTLNVIIREMRRRYATFQLNGVQDFRSYNDSCRNRMKYIVIVVDELAQLMIENRKGIEPLLIQIAQLGRAAGIHMILATQSPKKEVVTGLIRANVPAKLILRTATAIDSRIVLGQNGAERLLGKGDALFVSNDNTDPLRVQVPYISDELIKFIADDAIFCQATQEPRYPYLPAIYRRGE